MSDQSKTLFNKYEAYNDLGYELDRKVSLFIRDVVKEYPDIKTRELEVLITGVIMTSLAEERIRRAMRKRKQEREQ